MASEDKTYCGRGDRNDVDARELSAIKALAEKLGVSPQEVWNAIEQVGNDPRKVEAFFLSKENPY